jgi:hypothetical protein
MGGCRQIAVGRSRAASGPVIEEDALQVCIQSHPGCRSEDIAAGL